jgi:hypothetical protein
MKVLLVILSVWGGMFWFTNGNEEEHECKEEYYKYAYLKANTLLKYQDSINESGLIINLSKYQPEYVKSKMDALAKRQIK